MSRLKFIRSWHVGNPEGSSLIVAGKIAITLNVPTELAVGRPSQPPFVHKIEGYINDTIWWRNASITSENELMNQVMNCRASMNEEMERIHKNNSITPEVNLFNKLENMGFKISDK